MTNQRLTLLVTRPHPCSYLPEQQASTAFVDPDYQVTPYLFSRLAELGFRRSGTHIYRPQCHDCRACIPARVVVNSFVPKRSHLRCMKRNADLSIRVLDCIDNDACYELFERYINMRHDDGDMYPASREQFREFLCVPWPGTFYLAYYCQERLLAVSVCDRFDEGYSAVYTFFDPDEHQRSLGVFAVLNQINRAKADGLKYVYLGYWIKDCAKMKYKTGYRPVELLLNGNWRRLD